MNLKEKILIFRTCLAVLVVLKRLTNYLIINQENIRKKTTENLDCLIKPVNDHINFLYAQESKSKNG